MEQKEKLIIEQNQMQALYEKNALILKLMEEKEELQNQINNLLKEKQIGSETNPESGT